MQAGSMGSSWDRPLRSSLNGSHTSPWPPPRPAGGNQGACLALSSSPAKKAGLHTPRSCSAHLSRAVCTLQQREQLRTSQPRHPPRLSLMKRSRGGN